MWRVVEYFCSAIFQVFLASINTETIFSEIEIAITELHELAHYENIMMKSKV